MAPDGKQSQGALLSHARARARVPEERRRFARALCTSAGGHPGAAHRLMSDSRRLFHLDPLRRKRARQEMRDELAFHVEERVAQLIARGMSPEAARDEAIRRLGPGYVNTGDALERS